MNGSLFLPIIQESEHVGLFTSASDKEEIKVYPVIGIGTMSEGLVLKLTSAQKSDFVMKFSELVELNEAKQRLNAAMVQHVEKQKSAFIQVISELQQTTTRDRYKNVMTQALNLLNNGNSVPVAMVPKKKDDQQKNADDKDSDKKDKKVDDKEDNGKKKKQKKQESSSEEDDNKVVNKKDNENDDKKKKQESKKQQLTVPEQQVQQQEQQQKKDKPKQQETKPVPVAVAELPVVAIVKKNKDKLDNDSPSNPSPKDKGLSKDKKKDGKKLTIAPLVQAKSTSPHVVELLVEFAAPEDTKFKLYVQQFNEDDDSEADEDNDEYWKDLFKHKVKNEEIKHHFTIDKLKAKTKCKFRVRAKCSKTKQKTEWQYMSCKTLKEHKISKTLFGSNALDENKLAQQIDKAIDFLNNGVDEKLVKCTVSEKDLPLNVLLVGARGSGINTFINDLFTLVHQQQKDKQEEPLVVAVEEGDRLCKYILTPSIHIWTCEPTHNSLQLIYTGMVPPGTSGEEPIVSVMNAIINYYHVLEHPYLGMNNRQYLDNSPPEQQLLSSAKDLHIEMGIHAVALCVDYSKLEAMDQSAGVKLVKDLQQQLNVPCEVFATKVDEVAKLKNGLQNVINNKKMQAIESECQCRMMGVPKLSSTATVNGIDALRNKYLILKAATALVDCAVEFKQQHYDNVSKSDQQLDESALPVRVSVSVEYISPKQQQPLRKRFVIDRLRTSISDLVQIANQKFSVEDIVGFKLVHQQQQQQQVKASSKQASLKNVRDLHNMNNFLICKVK